MSLINRPRIVSLAFEGKVGLGSMKTKRTQARPKIRQAMAISGEVGLAGGKEMKPRVCVDFDNVICYHDIRMGPYKFGNVIPGAREFLAELKKKCFVVIYSARVHVDPTLVDDIKEYLDKNNLDYDEIYYGYGKSEAVAYIDDRAIECNPAEDTEAYIKTLGKIDKYIQKYYDGGVKWSR